MKNSFALSMTLLLALTLGGSILGYRLGTADKEKPGAEATVGAGQTSLGGRAGTSGVNTAAAPQEGTSKAAAPNPSADASTPSSSGAAAGSSASNTPAPATNKSGTPGNVNLKGTVSSNPADGSPAPSGPNAAQQTGTEQANPAGTEAATASDSAAGGDAAKGKATFASASCAGCHGANGGGGIGPNLGNADGPKAWTLAQFTTSLRNGQSPAGPLKSPMPQFGTTQLSDGDIADIHAYIKTLN
jgi:mono/diheme cytochrome c family protein